MNVPIVVSTEVRGSQIYSSLNAGIADVRRDICERQQRADPDHPSAPGGATIIYAEQHFNRSRFKLCLIKLKSFPKMN